jgi:hypothetical protein
MLGFNLTLSPTPLWENLIFVKSFFFCINFHVFKHSLELTLKMKRHIVNIIIINHSANLTVKTYILELQQTFKHNANILQHIPMMLTFFLR